VSVGGANPSVMQPAPIVKATNKETRIRL
jgi:hypothetical protein